MNLKKLVSAGMKAGGAAASGVCAAAIVITGGERLNNTGLALAGGLGVSAAVLAKQALSDVVAVFSDDEEQ